MELISEQKIIDSIKSNRTVVSEIEAYSEGFTSGVSFAEHELQNLSIEFAEWIGTEKCEYIPTGAKNQWINAAVTGIQVYIDSRELFELFLKQCK